MTDSPAISPLIQRLAISRLAAPGCVSCDQLQRSHERFSNPPGSRVSERLFRRMELSQPSAAGLLLARAEPSLEPGVTSTTKAEVVATQAASADSGNRPAIQAQAASVNPGSFVSNRLSRQSAGVTQAGTFLARKVAATPGVISSARVIQRLAERAADRLPSDVSISHRGTVAGFVTTPRSMSEKTFTSPATRVPGSIAPPAPASQPSVMRKAEPVVMTATASHPRAGSAGVSDSDSVSHAPTNDPVSVRPPVVAQRPLAATLHRRAEAAAVRSVESQRQSTATAGALAFTSKQPNASATDVAATNETIGAIASNVSAPLVLRKADSSAQPAAAAKQLPTISASAPSVIAREVVATPQLVSNQKEGARTTEQWVGGLDIERIVEQVERRLARRFEIERERQGVRAWRLEN